MMSAKVAWLAEEWQAGAGPLYGRLAAAVGSAIEAGRLPAGSGLPAERRLARALGVSRTTVVAAYDVLREAGRIESRRGSGSRVRAPATLPAPPAARAAPTVAVAAAGAAADAAAPAGATAARLPEVPRPFRHNPIFRSLVEGGGGARIEFLGAHLAAAHPFVEEELAAAAADLRPLLAQHGYQGLGLPELRDAIAGHLSAGGLPTAAEQVLVTSGAQQAIGLVAALCVQPGDAVAIEDPTYPGAIDAFADAGARLVSVPVTADGASLDRLREAVAREAPRLIYVTPSFHNPTGALMPAAQRRELALLAAEAGTPLVEDLTLADLDLGIRPPPPIAAALPGAPILTVGSLSKLVWAGLRVGWVRAETSIIARLARFKVLADAGGPVPSQVLATRLLPRAAAIRDARRRQLLDRLAACEGALAARLPEWTWRRPAGGLCLWVRLPRGNAEDFAQLALRHGVAIVPGPTCSPRDAWEMHLRLPFVLADGDLQEGIARLARAWAAYAPTAAPSLAAASAPPPPLSVLV